MARRFSPTIAIWRPFSAPGGYQTAPSKAAGQRFQGWGAYLGQFRYKIKHTSGVQNSWGDMLSRTVSTGSGSPTTETATVRYMRTGTVHVDALPGKPDIKAAQSAAVGRYRCARTGYGRAEADAAGLFWLNHRGRRVLWIPEEANELKQRLMICAHMKDTRHRGQEATVKRLRAFCVWDNMEKDVREVMHECLFCQDSQADGLVP